MTAKYKNKTHMLVPASEEDRVISAEEFPYRKCIGALLWAWDSKNLVEYFGPPSFNFEVNSNGKFAIRRKIEQPSNMKAA